MFTMESKFMMSNMDQNERMNFSVFGAIVLIGGLLNFHMYLWLVLGVFMVVQGVMGWCCVPWIKDYIKKKTNKSGS